MVKLHHSFFLGLLDNILKELNTPTKNYTYSYQELFKAVQPNIRYDKIYQNQFEKFLTQGYDSYIEQSNSYFLFNSALRYLVDDELIFQYNHSPNLYSFQINYKGFLKINNGFRISYDNEQKRLQDLEKRRNLDFIVSVLRLFVPAIVGFIFGVLYKMI